MSQLEERYKQYASDIKRNTEIAMDALDYILKCYVLMAHEESDGVYRQEEFDALEEAIDAFFFLRIAVPGASPISITSSA